VKCDRSKASIRRDRHRCFPPLVAVGTGRDNCHGAMLLGVYLRYDIDKKGANFYAVGGDRCVYSCSIHCGCNQYIVEGEPMTLRGAILALEKPGSLLRRFGGHILYQWFRGRTGTIVDVGCGNGRDFHLIRKSCHPAAIINLIDFQNNITGGLVTICDVEKDALPFPEKSVNAINCNQVLEHCKEIVWIKKEFSRVLKSGGMLVVGVPNLATWHDRLLLLFGRQPAEIKVGGPHVRGFTCSGLVNFFCKDGVFKIEEKRFCGFRPASGWLCVFLENVFPSLSTSIFLKLRRTDTAYSIADDCCDNTNYKT